MILYELKWAHLNSVCQADIIDKMVKQAITLQPEPTDCDWEYLIPVWIRRKYRDPERMENWLWHTLREDNPIVTVLDLEDLVE